MDPSRSARPRVSRETRLLLLIVLISVSALWILARIRFPHRPVTANPVPQVLSHFTQQWIFEDMAAAVAQLEPRLSPQLVPFEPRSASGRAAAVVPALRVRPGLAVGLLAGAGPPEPDPRIVARDPASGLTLVRTDTDVSPELTTWTPRRAEQPRFLIAGEVSSLGSAFRPMFVSTLVSITTPTWSGPLWTMPPRRDLTPGSFMFTLEGALAGLVIERQEGLSIVPSDSLMRGVDWLLQRGPRAQGTIGVSAETLTPELVLATGVRTGVIVTWVDPDGPAAGQLSATNVVQSVNGETMATIEHWRTRVARLGAGDTVALRVLQGAEARDVQLTAKAATPTIGGSRSLGLTMEAIRRVGTRIVDVDEGSAAARAGIRPGDVLTRVAALDAPTPAQITAAFSQLASNQRLLAALARDGSHHVVVLTSN